MTRRLRAWFVRWLDLSVPLEVFCPCDECGAWRARRTTHRPGRAVVFKTRGGREPVFPTKAQADRAERMDN